MDLMIPRLEKFALEGMFGEINLLRVGPSSNEEKSAQFQSKLGFFEVDLITRTGKVRKVPVVVKLQNDDIQPHQHEAFANEVIAYDKMIPALEAKDLFPISYHAHATRGQDPNQDILILEDLRPQGYQVPKDTILDDDHIHLAMQTLGTFHGLSYKIKSTSPAEFSELKELLTEKYVWEEEGSIHESILRAFQEDLQSSPGYSVLNKAYKKLTSKSASVLQKKLHSPEEPFAVFIHGDFLKNNVLFKYDDAGKPSEMKMFDMATAMYGDPTVDLSLFLYMHTSKAMRDEHWNEYLKSYWDGVQSVGNPGFTFREFMANFAKKAVYGFIISAFFLPLMLHPEELHIFGAGYPEKSKEEKREIARTYGGEIVTVAVRNVLKSLLNEGYLEEFLLHFDLSENSELNGGTSSE